MYELYLCCPNSAVNIKIPGNHAVSMLQVVLSVAPVELPELQVGQEQGWQGRSEGTARTDKFTRRGLWCQEGSEGKLCPSDRDQGETEPRDCQPAHGDAVRPRSSRAQPVVQGLDQ